MQKKIGNVILNYKYYSGTDSYSDGQIEDKLLELVKNNESAEYNRLIYENSNWAILYHLSDVRTNILDVVDFNGHERVLEIGAGCGAITGKLAEKVGKVTCIDLSRKRSLINAYRNKNKNNIEIYVGNFETVQQGLEEKYDYITLIGVFEYGQYYISSALPYEDFLLMIKKHLKKDGKIIIAIENKFGMKYWAGCKEDHLNKFYSGIEGYRDSDRARTFSKLELEKILQKTGLNEYRFFYPYPDYKLPEIIYSDSFLPVKNELEKNIRNFDTDRLMLFDEKLAFNNVIDSEMFPFFSNSFLIVCGMDKIEEDAYCKINNDCAPEFQVIEKKTIKEKKFNRWKEANCNTAIDHIRKIYEGRNAADIYCRNACIEYAKCDLEDKKIWLESIEGQNFQEFLLQSQCKCDGKDIADIKKLFENLFSRTEEFDESIEFKKVFGEIPELQGAVSTRLNIDLTFDKMIYQNEKWIIADYEWFLDCLIPIDYLKYKMISHYLKETEQENREDVFWREFHIDNLQRKIFSKMNDSFQKYIQGQYISLEMMYDKIHGRLWKLDEIATGNTIRNKKALQVYFDYGNGFNEADSMFPTMKKMENDEYSVDILLEDNVKAVRIDPAQNAAEIKIISVINEKKEELKIESNGYILEDKIVFLNDDPQMSIRLFPGMKAIHMEYKIRVFV